MVLSAAALLALVSAGCGAPAPTQAANQAETLSATTPDPAGDTGPITWALYRATNSLDPIKAFDMPENAVVDSLCESLLREQPDLTIAPGLAKSADYANPTTLVLTLRSDVRFWDGTPLTPADVVFSLERARDPKAGGFYSSVFDRVKSIEATGASEVTIHLAQPDYWLRGQLSTMAGSIIEKAYAERAGDNYGTPSGGAMCTGPFKVKSWNGGGDVVIERNPSHWNTGEHAKAAQITFKAVEPAAAVAALTTGDIQGYYNPTLPAYQQLKQGGSVNVVPGPSLTTDALVVTNLQGPLGDVRVRRALSLAIDRQAYSNSVYHGQVSLPRTSTNPGTWAYAKPVFASTSAVAPVLGRDLDQAKQLVQQAGAQGKTVVLAAVPALNSLNTFATVVSDAAKALGLDVQMKTFSPDVFGTLFTDPKAREGIDMMSTLNGPSYADPGPYLATYTLPDGSQNYSGWQDAKVTQLLSAARETADDTTRAQTTAEADKLITDQLPWIPITHPNSVLYLSKKLTGAPTSDMFMSGPWAINIGAAK